MQGKGLTNLARNDADFDRRPGLTRYAPACERMQGECRTRRRLAKTLVGTIP